MSRRDQDQWVFGRHAVETLLDKDPSGVLELWVSASSRGDFVRQAVSSAERHGIAVQTVPRKTLDRKLEGASHQGIAARCARRRTKASVDLESVLERLGDDDVLLVLDEVQDPHNLGACLRTADAAGVVAVVVPRRRAAGLTPAARKVASGAAESVPFVEAGNLADALRRMRTAGVRLIGACDDAPSSLYEASLGPGSPLAVVLGAEGKGMRQLTRSLCDELVRVPMLGVVSSLNVGVAAGVVLFEVRRQRGAPAPGVARRPRMT